MTEQERKFKESINNKIKTYQIKDHKKNVTVNMCLEHATNKFVTNRYYDGHEELIDVGIERYLCCCSPFYFISEYCSFTLPGTGELSGKALYYYQQEILKDFINWKRVVLTKSRQTGLSTLMSLIFFWKVIFFSKEWGVIISKDATSSADVLDKIKENLKNIPFWLGLKIKKNNEKKLEFSNGSKIQSFAKSKSSGRGTSPTVLLLDEFAFYQTKSIAQGIISATVPSVTATGGSIYVVSTPNGTTGEGELYYRQVQDLRNAGGKDEIEGAVLYDVQWWMCPDKIRDGGGPYKGYNKKLEEYEQRDFWNHPEVKKEAEDFFKPIAEKPKENPWLSFQFSQQGEVKYRQEILQDFVVMGNSVFSADTLERWQTYVINPIAEGDLNNRYWKGLWYWRKPEKEHRYALGVDVAKGSSNDSSAVNIIDLDYNEQVAEYLGHCTTKELGKIVNDLGKYYNDAYVIIESNSIGEAVFNDLYYNYNYNNMYKMKKINKNDRTQVWTGWMTTTKTRELITNNFIDLFSDEDMTEGVNIHSQRLLDQMKTWVWAGGRPDHTENTHDDDIMSFAIVLYNLNKARQLLPKSKEKNQNIVFIKSDGTQVGFSSNEKSYEANEEDISRIKNTIGYNDSFSDEDPLEIYKWLLS